ncbi:hypothetical protein DMC47_04730 [Nostoc sp. 3335mG]|nr:hypothetical protein DMC47_04730 [Nostoc sp. 3335mG]
MDYKERVAVELREKLGIPDDILIDPMDLLRRLKLTKVISGYKPSYVRSNGNAAWWDSSTREIVLSPLLWRELQSGVPSKEARFTVFHELAHAVLGHGKRNRKAGGKVQFGAYTESDERDADDLALAIMIPFTLVDDAPIRDINALSSMFGLPHDKASNRAVILQKHARLNAGAGAEEDTYATAMRVMAENARAWNA